MTHSPRCPGRTLAALVAAALFAGAACTDPPQSARAPEAATFQVERRDLRVTVTEKASAAPASETHPDAVSNLGVCGLDEEKALAIVRGTIASDVVLVTERE